jgi:hypothetical protein
MRGACERWGYTVTKSGDYYSPTPRETYLHRNAPRWTKPSALEGVNYDLAQMQQTFGVLIETFYGEFAALPSYESLTAADFGPGFNEVDAFTLYAVLRKLQPKRYIEVGSGLSTYYSHLARSKNREDGIEMEITCIEPYPYQALLEIDGIKLIQSEVQDVRLETFKTLSSGDVLFIDSSHVVRLDGDVPCLLLEVLPALAPGVYIHIHDIPFPYNIPYPADYWTLLQHPRSRQWPVFWNEAMLLQAFLAFNSSFEIVLSCPLLRYFTEKYLKAKLPIYKSTQEEPNTFSSIWLRRAR